MIEFFIGLSIGLFIGFILATLVISGNKNDN